MNINREDDEVMQMLKKMGLLVLSNEEIEKKMKKAEKERIRQRKKKLKKQTKKLNKLQGDKRTFRKIQYTLEHTNMTIEQAEEKDKYKIINKYNKQVLFIGDIQEVEDEALGLAYIYFSN